MKKVYRYFESQLNTTMDSFFQSLLQECDDLQSEEIWRPLCFCLEEHVLSFSKHSQTT